MAEQSKFSGALAKLKTPSTDQVVIDPPVVNMPSTRIEVLRGKGRPPGKRSDPDFQPTTLLLRKQTKRKANRILEDVDEGQDLSDLVETLLMEWIKRSS